MVMEEINHHQEEKYVAIILALVILITSVPYFLGFAMQKNGMVFSGFVMGIEDGNSYIAKMMLGYSGKWMFTTPYTSAPQSNMFIYLPYILFGKLASRPGLHDQMLALFQFFRIVGIVIYGIGLYRFLCLFLNKTQSRMIGLILGMLGGGLGWIFIIPGLSGWYDYLPLDYYSPESFGFLSVFLYPHNTFARGLMLIGLVEFIQIVDGQIPSGFHNLRSWLPGLCFFVAGFFQPLNSGIGTLLAGIYTAIWIIKNQSLRIKWIPAIITAFLGSGWVIYLLVLNIADPFFKTWTSQNVLLSPNPVQYLIAYGVCLCLIALNFDKLRIAINNNRIIFLITWMILMPVLAYIPSNLQRRFPEAVWCAFLTLALFLIEANWGKWTKVEWSGLLAVSLVSPVIILLTSSFGILNNSSMQFIQNDRRQAYEALLNLPVGNVVFCSYRSGNDIPAWAPLKVVDGLVPESVGHTLVQGDIQKVFSTETTHKERISILSKYGADYLLVDGLLKRIHVSNLYISKVIF
jgi:hypothetical protein